MNPFSSFKTQTIHTLDGRELDARIRQDLDVPFDAVRDGEIPGDDSHGFVRVRVQPEIDPYDHTIFEHFARQKARLAFCDHETILKVFLSHMCARGEIPAGDYHILYSWG